MSSKLRLVDRRLAGVQDKKPTFVSSRPMRKLRSKHDDSELANLKAPARFGTLVNPHYEKDRQDRMNLRI